MEKWRTPGSGIGHGQDKSGASRGARKQENAHGLIGMCHKNKGASLKDLSLTKFGVILASNRIMNVIDYNTTQNNLNS